MLDTLWMSLIGLAAIGAVILAVVILKNRPLINFTVVAITVVLLADFPGSFNIASIGGVNIAFMDVYSLVLISIFLIHRPLSPRGPAVCLSILFALIVLAAIVIGCLRYGIPVAVNESRQFIWSAACLLWSTTLPWRSSEFYSRVLRLLVILGWSLVLVALYRASKYGFAAYGEDVLDLSGMYIDPRILVSGQALMMLFSLMAAFALSRNQRSARWWLVSSCSFLVVLVLSQQRTVWAVASAVVALGILIDRRPRAHELVGSLTVLIIVGIMALAGLFDSALTLLSGATQDTRTYDGRSEGWIALINHALGSGPGTFLIGEPFGYGYARVESGRIATYSPHNWYLTIFLRVGIVGLSAYCLAIIVGLVGLLRHSFSRLPFLVVVGLCIYSWTYSVPWYAAVLLGGAFVMSTVRLARRGSGAQSGRYTSMPIGTLPKLGSSR